MPVHYNLMGDETTDPEQFVYCAACRKEVNHDELFNEAICACGSELYENEDFLTGRMLRLEREKVDQDLAEWTELNRQSLRADAGEA